MDPDAEAEQAASQILRTSLIAVVFTACTHKTETCLPDRQATASVNHIHFSLPDSTASQPAPALPKKKKKTIYLTFDDGPNRGTKKMMHIVQEEKISVTLFIVGQHIYGSKEQTSTMDSLLAGKYFEIANHSYSHAFGNKFVKFYNLPDSAAKDFMRCADSLHLTSNIIRTPGRNIWRTANINCTDLITSKAAADSLYKDGFTEVGWDLEWRFDEQLKLRNTGDEMLVLIDSMFAKGRTKTKDNLVLLAHDQVYEDANDSAELHQFIKKLKAKEEYNFETVSKYPGLKQ